tara:strand:+ start:18705 stop:19232 length:528 start_codon:yes stop_codon:yes gene_type:complete
MSEETKEIQQNQEETQPLTTSEVNEVEVGSLVAESKKYRQRAQSAEKKLEELQMQQQKQQDEQLAKNEEWKTLAEQRAKKIEELEPIVQQAEEYKEKQRALLLADFSEEDRKDFEHLALPDLQKVHTKILKQKVVKTENSVSGFSQVPQKKMMEMDKKERRQNWQGILQSYKRKG